MSTLAPSTPRPITPEVTGEALAPVREALRTVLGTAGDVFLDRPGFVASDDEVNPLSAAVRAITRFNCRRWAAADKSQFSQRVNTGNAQICGPYLDSLGESPGDPEIAPPFTGGQCNLAYTFVIESQGNPSPLADVFANRSTRGPIVGWRVAVEGTRTRGYVTSHHPGVAGCAAVGASQGLQERQWFDVQTRDRPVPFTARVLSVCGGLPDSCGDPPNEIRPPGRPIVPPVIAPEITINLPGLGPVTVTVELDPDGDPVICVEELDVCFTIDIGNDGDGGSEGGGTAPGDGAPGSPESVAPPAFDGTPGESGEDIDFGPPPAGSVWVGALVRFQAPASLGAAAGSGPNRAYPRVVGNASLVYAGGRGEAKQMRSEWRDLVRPVTSLEVTGCFVNTLPGVIATVRPISAIVCPDDICGGGDG